MFHRKCQCGGNKIITETTSEILAPNQYDWRCEKCGKEGIGWSFGPQSKYFPVEREEEVWEEVGG